MLLSNGHAGWRGILMATVSVAALGVVSPIAAQDATPATPQTNKDEPAASEPATSERDKVEKVTVTGTRLRKDEFSSPSPVQIVDPKRAERLGSVDTATTIQSSSIAQGSAQITSAISSAFVTNGGPGTQTISLRGLGAERTLVLLNGRRAGPAGIRGAVGPFDLNVIPQSVIQSVEILKDGASSVYGSDAVAGVVNIITRKDTDGLQIDGFYSQPFESGGEEQRLSGSYGLEFDGGHVSASLDYYKRNELKRGDRKYLDCPEDYIFNAAGARIDRVDPRTGKYACRDTLWGHVWLYDYTYLYTTSNLFATNGQAIRRMQYNYAGDNLQNYIPPLAPPADPFQFAAPAGWFPVGYNPASYGVENAMHPFISNSTVVPETTRYTAFVEGDYQITDAITLYGELIFNRRETEQNSFRQFWNFGFSSNFDGSGFGDPFATGFTGAVLLSPTAITDWVGSSQKVDYYRAVGGAKGEFGAALSGWAWDLYGQYSRSDGEYYQQQILDDAVDSQDFRTASCVGTFLPKSGRPCIDINFTDPEFLRGNLTPAQRAFLFDAETGTTIYSQLSFEGTVDGTLFQGWAGPVDAAIGVTWRHDEIKDTPGPITLARNAWGFSSSGITQGESTTREIFGEVDVPLITDAPFVKYLNLRLSGRHTDVDTVGESDQTYKIGGNWQVNDWLRFRGTYGTSFRAPQLFELFLNNQTAFPAQRDVDPCIQWGPAIAAGTISQRLADNCAADGIPPNYLGGTISATSTTSGGLGRLIPETSVAKTLSVVLTPNDFLPDTTQVSLALDYFEIEVEGEITQLGPFNIVSACYLSPTFPNSPFCDLFERVPVGSPDALSVATVTDDIINISNQKNRGIDVTARLRQELPNGWGDVSILAQMTWQFEDTVALFPGTEVSVNGEDGEPIWVGDFTIEWSRDEWSVLWGIDATQHTSDVGDFLAENNGNSCPNSGILEQPVCRDLIAESSVIHSVSVTREWDDWRITAGVANIFDDEPPRVSTNNLSTITTIGQSAFSNYDLFGRRGFLSVSKKF